MDATFFRALCQELSGQICGMRIEKVFAPAVHLWTIGMGRVGFLVLHAGKALPFLLLTTHKPENPPRPSGQAMWLRTRVRDRRIVSVRPDWQRRQIALELSPGVGRWLILGLTQAPTMMDALPEEFGIEPLWPDVQEMLSQVRIWEGYPHISPPLRRMLAGLDPAAATAFVERLQAGVGQKFFVVRDHRGQLQARLWPEGDEVQAYATALTAAEHAYGPVVARLVRGEEEETRAGRDRARRVRALARLEADRVALEAMIAGGAEGRWLCAALHGLDKQARYSSVQVLNDQGEPVELALRPDWTVLENMRHRFQRAAKGHRGLPLVAARMEALRRELDAPDALCPNGDEHRAAPDVLHVASGLGASSRGVPSRFARIRLSVFRSSNGFMLLRGRSAEANRQLVQAARPFDYWLHAQDGPGAHVLIVREHAMQDVPEMTILEGACLAALSSYLRSADRGDVLLCLAKDVRAAKGAAAGRVNVQSVLRVVRPRVDPDVEERLRVTLLG